MVRVSIRGIVLLEYLCARQEYKHPYLYNMVNRSSSSWRDYVYRLYGLRLFFCLLLALQLFTALYYYVRVGRYPYGGELVYQGVSILSWASIPVLLAALVPWVRVRRVLVTLVLVIYGFLVLFEGFLTYSYSSVYTDSIALNILATNPNEASSFLTNLNYKAFFLPLISLVLLFGLYYLVRKRIVSKGSHRQVWSFFVFLVLPISLSFAVVHPAQRATRSFLYMAPVERIYRGTMACVQDARDLATYAEQLKHIDLGKIEQSGGLDSVTVVIIVGESMRRDYMHCYGYPLPNTPKQDSLASTGDLILFTDVVSSTSWTVGSVSQSMSFYTREEEPTEWYKFPTLPFVLSKAGYYTYWLSNQESQGAGLQPLTTLARTADSTRFAKIRTGGDWDAAQDLDLLPLLGSRAMIPGGHGAKALFQIVHLMGSHSPYGDRCPKEMARFQTADLPRVLPNGLPSPTDTKRAEVIRDYVNSIYYNDLVVSKIIDHFSSEPSIILYFSDHGQAIYENPKRPDYCEHEVSRPGVTIPLMVYLSPAMRQQHPELYDRVLAVKDRKIMTDLIANSVLGLLGIKMKYYNPRLDFFSPSYDTARRRVIIGYDGTEMEL